MTTDAPTRSASLDKTLQRDIKLYEQLGDGFVAGPVRATM
jgi:hypothetical protein